MNTPKYDFVTVPLSEIDASTKHNVRQTGEDGKYAGVDLLAEDIKKNGLSYPLLVESKANGGKFRLLDGFRRYNACLIAGLTEVPIKVEVVKDEKDAFLRHVKSNVARRSLSTYEMAVAFARMRQDYGMGGKAIAEQMQSGDGALDGDTINNMARIVEKLAPSILETWADPLDDDNKFCTLNNLLRVIGKNRSHDEQLAEWEDIIAEASGEELPDDETEGPTRKAGSKKEKRPSPKLIENAIAMLKSAKGVNASQREAAVAALEWAAFGGKLKVGDWKFDPEAVKKAEEAAKEEARLAKEAEREKLKEAEAKIRDEAKAKLEALHGKKKG